MTTAAEYTERLSAALARGQATHSPLDEDLAQWPEDVRPTVQIVCALWHLHAPRHKKDKGLWIEDARRLMDACGEWGLDAVKKYRQEFEHYMASHAGVAMHTVSGPGSLVKMCREAAAHLREKPRERRYSEGIYGDYVNH